MTSKEALEILRECANGEKKLLFTDSLDLANTIKQDLERLETINGVWHKNEPTESVDINGKHLQELYDFINKLTQENQHLKTTNEALNEMLLQASDEAIKVEQENEILKMSVKDTYDTSQEIIGDLTQQNEKLKKAIEILKQYIQLDLECNIYHEIRMGREMIVIPQQEYDLLKEVLGNAT